MQNLFSGVVDWTFLNEPAWRWAVFFVGASMFIYVWNDVLSLMK
jgi:hypothetical protein